MNERSLSPRGFELLACARLHRRRKNTRGLTLAELLGTIGFVSILGALAMYGVAKYLRHSKTVEAVSSTTAIAQAACEYYNQSDANQPAGTKPDAAKAMRHFPPSSRASVPASLDDIRGKRFQSAVGDWSTSPWLDLGFKISTPQFYAYSFESQGSGPSAQASAVAHGDLDGNGVASTFRATVAPDDSFTCKLKGAVVQTDPDE
jgi:type II secretory pathway pseudopilin PulG